MVRERATERARSARKFVLRMLMRAGKDIKRRNASIYSSLHLVSRAHKFVTFSSYRSEAYF